MLRVLSGVLQGYPFSGSLFDLCHNLFLLMMKEGA